MPLTTPTLATDRLLLRPFADSDSDAIYALQSDPVALRYWDSPPWTEREQATRFLERSRTMAEEEAGVRVVLQRASDSAFLGWCSLSNWNHTFRSAILGYCLTPSAWGHGYATEAARAVVTWGFATLGLNRIASDVDTRNPASARVLQKLGFTLEGTLREDCIVAGEISDSWIYGLLRREWAG